MTQEWQEQIAEMDRLCRLHLDVGYETVNTKGHQIFVKLGPTERQLPLSRASIIIPEDEKINQIFCGLVLGLGEYAFKDGVATKWTEGPLCKVGDYVIFFAPESIKFRMNNYNVALIRDSNIIMTTDNPSLFGNYGISRFGSSKANKVIFKREHLEAQGLKCLDSNIRFAEDLEEVGA